MPKNDQAISSGVQTKQHPGKRSGSLSAGSAILSIGAAVLTNLLLSGRGAPWDFAFECASLAGDAFAAAAVYAVLSGFSPQRCIDFACAAFCMKHTVEGDIFLAGRQEIEALAKGDASGNIVR